MGAIVAPFHVGAEIGHRGFDLDNMQPAVVGKRHDVGAAPRQQRQFSDGGEVQPAQQAADAAGDEKRRLRLAAVVRRAGLHQGWHWWGGGF